MKIMKFASKLAVLLITAAAILASAATITLAQQQAPKYSLDQAILMEAHRACLDVYGIPDNQTGDCSRVPQP
ncbi:MAG: hypothetical protein A3C11_00495 [Candidatus Sungbacteria bacterium RIFCSPHIGHO2_02_FULL_49_12]|uniref:Uncharacterized protein n=1 Tax=Candidatus Sungbacteria bacterium RIFCSPHIGHO2_02_FULL_49_12 TaxID=1802271 RepID=A0A1G2KPE7_9BACT|nr:MAG: hypothetical protein A3C11_00495 [Candidatus Sungbacteria bacterium RIFCSPHIGHO2_02_FULL_49_12]